MVKRSKKNRITTQCRFRENKQLVFKPIPEHCTCERSRKNLRFCILSLNGEQGFTLGRTQQNMIYLKKSCSELNFLQKTRWTHCPISLHSQAGDIQRLPFLKYFNTLEWESITLRLNATKNTKDIKKCFKQKLFKIKFLTKNLVNAHPYLPQKWSQGPPKITIFEIL